MPQMSPLWWDCLFMMFVTLYILTMMCIFHMISYYKVKKSSHSLLIKYMTWKW
uniref:ATP synthase F0 subunit 8 n=1 Tax=Cyclopelta parva TaxID=696241 RepID=A0A343W8V5_9HEMI|nr:ATP synthase F0 subunit 8 [Cyclopelta parva]AVZ00795.1 ATP synthase F0 subunit 8 [Cyclopelta parva]